MSLFWWKKKKQKGPDVNIEDEKDAEALLKAADGGDIASVQALLAKGADVKCQK